MIDAGSIVLTHPAGAVAIVGATVVPLDRDGVLEGHTVVIRDGVIETVAPWGAVDVRGMDVIDGADRYVVPGLSDLPGAGNVPRHGWR